MKCDSEGEFQDEGGKDRHMAAMSEIRLEEHKVRRKKRRLRRKREAKAKAAAGAAPPARAAASFADLTAARTRQFPRAAAAARAHPLRAKRLRSTHQPSPPGKRRSLRPHRPTARTGDFAKPQRDYRQGRIAFSWLPAHGYPVSWIYGGVPAPLREELAGQLRLLCDGEAVLELRRGAFGLGVFAARDLQSDDIATIFQGPRVARGEHDPAYGMLDPRGRGVYNPDPADLHALGHFLNHSDDPNCRVGRDMAVRAAHRISAGTELTIDYGDEYKRTW